VYICILLLLFLLLYTILYNPISESLFHFSNKLIYINTLYLIDFSVTMIHDTEVQLFLLLFNKELIRVG